MILYLFVYLFFAWPISYVYEFSFLKVVSAENILVLILSDKISASACHI